MASQVSSELSISVLTVEAMLRYPLKIPAVTVQMKLFC